MSKKIQGVLKMDHSPSGVLAPTEPSLIQSYRQYPKYGPTGLKADQVDGVCLPLPAEHRS
ncbi:hypothetical protein BJX63DRAFT_400743 [Aspergillus granulosus]|uniref:Uncharacterized protein n=1 Tax=Aspergillus granulosus TaxID=176169 RepID=A0ABR4H5X4_9EURO